MADVKMKTIDYGSGDRFIISPDWENVDNKPEHLTSWGEKTTYGDTLFWDGNTEGCVYATGNATDIVKISGAVPTAEDFAKGWTAKTSAGETISGTDLTEYNGMLTPENGEFMVIREDNLNSGGVIFPEKGIYTFDGTDGMTTVLSLTIPAYEGFEHTEITPLPHEYLDFIETVGSDTLTWDGNTDGLEVGYERDGSDTFVLYRISEATPSYNELISNGYSYSNSYGYSYTSAPGEGVDYAIDNVIVTIGGYDIWIVYEDNVTYSDDGLGVEIPKKGIYVYEPTETYVTSLTINGYTGFPKEHVKEEYLPKHSHDWNWIEICNEENVELIFDEEMGIYGNVIETDAVVPEGFTCGCPVRIEWDDKTYNFTAPYLDGNNIRENAVGAIYGNSLFSFGVDDGIPFAVGYDDGVVFVCDVYATEAPIRSIKYSIGVPSDANVSNLPFVLWLDNSNNTLRKGSSFDSEICGALEFVDAYFSPRKIIVAGNGVTLFSVIEIDLLTLGDSGVCVTLLEAKTDGTIGAIKAYTAPIMG